jgi:hypothetical protein
MNDNQKKLFEDFIQINIADYYLTEILGQNSFREILDDLKMNVLEILNKAVIVILKTNTKIPQRLIESTSSYVNKINNFLGQIKKYDYNKDTNSNRPFGERNRIAEEIRSFISYSYQQQNSNDLLYICSTIISLFDIDYNNIKKDIESIKENYRNELNEITSKKDVIDELINTLRTQTTKTSTENYAQVFNNDANMYSSNNFIKPKRAEKWFWFSIAFTIILVLFLFFYVPNLVINTINGFDISILLLKISILFVLIYLIRFGFKQYSINKHLYSLNRHRANVLNSFKLLISSVDESNLDVRNAIVMEVSKVIYESGKTGYIEDKSDDGSSPSIIELTRVLGSKQS